MKNDRKERKWGDVMARGGQYVGCQSGCPPRTQVTVAQSRERPPSPASGAEGSQLATHLLCQVQPG